VDEQLKRVRKAVSDEEWTRRLDEADRQAAVMERVLGLVRSGISQREAFRREGPEEPRTTWVARLRQYRAGGRDALIDRRVPVQGEHKITPLVIGLVQGLVEGRKLYSPDVKSRLEALTGERWSLATVRRAMVLAGVAQPAGRPSDRETVTAHPLAGAELLLAVDQEIGATARLASDLHLALQRLPAPTGEVRDDRADRDENGRFLPSYNEPSERTEPELGSKFDSVELQRQGKDLPAMRVAHNSVGVLERKLRALVMLPTVTDSPRWEALRHWEGDHLEALVGIGYKPATMDKFLRELKYADVPAVLAESGAAFWVGQDGMVQGPLASAVMVYADTAVKAVWTHHFTRCAKVSGRGRVMPAISTMFLNVGPGTPILYRSFSGTASLRAEVPALLREYEKIAGLGTVRRVVVIDREGDSVGFMKALTEAGWQFIIPLRKSVTGPSARFEELTDWVPYNEVGDEVRGGWVWLNDSHDRKNPLRVRVVARRRHRTGKVAWYATTTDIAELPDTIVIDRYFDRWPLQEHRFRDGNGRVHLDAHHGHGKQKVDNVAVLDRRETLQGQLQRVDTDLAKLAAEVAQLRAAGASIQQALDTTSPGIDHDRAALDEVIATGAPMTPTVRRRHWALRLWETWRDGKRKEAAELASKIGVVDAKISAVEGIQARKQADLERTESQTRIFTVDVALDQVMTSLKLTFMNLCAVFMTRYLDGKRLQLDTLIRGILTLPGERVRAGTTETIRIYRHDRDRELMPLIDGACRLLTEKNLVRGGRRLRFELVEPPTRPGGTRRTAAADTGRSVP